MQAPDLSELFVKSWINTTLEPNEINTFFNTICVDHTLKCYSSVENWSKNITENYAHCQLIVAEWRLYAAVK